MTVLSDQSLLEMLPVFFPDHADPSLVNPASVDIRVGRKLLREPKETELFRRSEPWIEVDLQVAPYELPPNGFVLVETLERIVVPNGYAMGMKLKSSRAREGFDHSLAFWFDPGWDGIGTMEIQNRSQVRPLLLSYGLRIGQCIFFTLDRPAVHPYDGRYNQAQGVEPSKG